MRMTDLFGRRHRERAADTDTTSHDLLVRAGYVRQHAAGIYTYLTPGLRSLRRIERIIREEMDATGAQEILMSVAQSAEPWKATGRWASIDDTLVRFRDRHGRDMVLGMTHEEIVAELAASEIGSYRQAGVVVYQIQTKFRDEMRPRGGLLRTREFIMKDAYSLSMDQAGLERAYAAQAAAYLRIFGRSGLRDVHVARSATGDMGGRLAHEFIALHEAGDDTIALCTDCGDASNIELIHEAAMRSETTGQDATTASCSRCGGRVETHRGIEIGNIFQLGTGYSEALGARATDRDGRRRPLVMGSYGIGVSRLLATAIEQHHDAAGIALPAAIAPFDVQLIAIGDSASDEARMASNIAAQLRNAQLEILFDDRDIRPGEKFADADLIGATLRVVVGRRSNDGYIEVRERRTGGNTEIGVDQAAAGIRGILNDVARREARQVGATLEGRLSADGQP
jgi:prolyl-tRNA synthetase